jgi:trans-aconitate methyltransferase
MIAKAVENNADPDISFRCCSAEQLDYKNEFDRIFCNSALQWFGDSQQALNNCYDALKDGGKMAIQAPARDYYCTNFIIAIEEIKKNSSIHETFARFVSPWLFRNTAKEYSELFD